MMMERLYPMIPAKPTGPVIPESSDLVLQTPSAGNYCRSICTFLSPSSARQMASGSKAYVMTRTTQHRNIFKRFTARNSQHTRQDECLTTFDLTPGTESLPLYRMDLKPSCVFARLRWSTNGLGLRVGLGLGLGPIVDII